MNFGWGDTTQLLTEVHEGGTGDSLLFSREADGVWQRRLVEGESEVEQNKASPGPECTGLQQDAGEPSELQPSPPSQASPLWSPHRLGTLLKLSNRRTDKTI